MRLVQLGGSIDKWMRFTLVLASERQVIVYTMVTEIPYVVQILYVGFAVNAILIDSAGNSSGSDSKIVSSLSRPERIFDVSTIVGKKYHSHC